MIDDFDPILRGRLGSLAAAVPVRTSGALQPVVGTGPRYRGRSRFTAFGAVAILLVLIGGVTYLAGGGGAEAVTASSTDGTFTLTIASPRDHYVAGDPIEASATIEYVGAIPKIQVSGTPGVPGFGVEQVGGPNHASPAYRLSCVAYAFANGQPVAFPFSKSGGFTPDDPSAEFMKAYLNIAADHPDPILRLPAGTWRIFADMNLTEGECAGSTNHHLEAAITIVVDEIGTAVASPPASEDTAGPSATPSPEIRPAFPGVCPKLGVTLNQCAGFAAWAVGQAGIEPGRVQGIEMTKTTCPGASPCPSGATGSVVNVHIVTDRGAASDQVVDCTRMPMSLGGINVLCDTISNGAGLRLQYPQLDSPISGGYHDTPCSGEGPIGCATALPTIEPSALAESMRLAIGSVEIPIDRAGRYSVVLGQASLPSGILSAASANITSSPANPLVSYDGYQLVVKSLDGGPPFDNYYQHGWRSGTERVQVSLDFTILMFAPGAVVEVSSVDVR